ncbi:putative heat shock protein HspR [Arthrobacter globiformis NBRC 12137]|jgi:chaperone modulatory protein CbpM|uniref:Putative heat shock protein HspR n=1 Tax=Arthrobacter globiformis (strain ATCC 8010 / DSM 20124 / JCM 1332 / NBRC 12137 / NCIMB 8907 / NRRL B-2979 / 168) TaxID=1077972 RepID=H0QLS7_ARTG1|nr:chaperone modulator CbpM [Arthrobacter globiformis]GAB13778.1 putative heat shock protein HspR [Arthrobacter globiformis NBRC 12137]
MSREYPLAYPWRLNLEAVARSSGVHPDVVMRFVDLDLIRPLGDASGGPWFSPRAPELIARVMRLHSELSLNYAAIPLVLDLLVRVDSLERRLVEITQVEGTASR